MILLAKILRFLQTNVSHLVKMVQYHHLALQLLLLKCAVSPGLFSKLQSRFTDCG